MSKPTVYLETTIPSYCVARPSSVPLVAEYQRITREWWAEERANYEIFVSELVIEEISGGDAEMAAARQNLIAGLAELDASVAAIELAEDILRTGFIAPKARADALHIAIAGFNRIEFLLTWNCRHINNAQSKRHLRPFFAARGLELPAICTPLELRHFPV